MYSSVSDNDFAARRARAEEEARSAYGRSVSSGAVDPPATAVSSSPVESLRGLGGRLGGLLSRVKDDDLLLIGLFFLLFDDHKNDDPLILLILAVLLFS